MQVSYTHELPMGHRLQNHGGRCRYAHGHNYLVTVRLRGDVDAANGMVADFSFLKHGVRRALEPYDHAFALESGDPLAAALNDFARLRILAIPPTAEALAVQWRTDIAMELHVAPDLLEVEVLETRDCGVRL